MQTQSALVWASTVQLEFPRLTQALRLKLARRLRGRLAAALGHDHDHGPPPMHALRRGHGVAKVTFTIGTAAAAPRRPHRHGTPRTGTARSGKNFKLNKTAVAYKTAVKSMAASAAVVAELATLSGDLSNYQEFWWLSGKPPPCHDQEL